MMITETPLPRRWGLAGQRHSVRFWSHITLWLLAMTSTLERRKAERQRTVHLFVGAKPFSGMKARCGKTLRRFRVLTDDERLGWNSPNLCPACLAAHYRRQGVDGRIALQVR